MVLENSDQQIGDIGRETGIRSEYQAVFGLVKRGDYSNFEWIGQGTFSEAYDYQLPNGDYVVIKVTSDRATRESLMSWNVDDIKQATELGVRGKAPIADNSLETVRRVQHLLEQYNEGRYSTPQPNRLSQINFARVLAIFDDGAAQVEILESVEFLDTEKTLLVGVCLADMAKQGVLADELKDGELLSKIQQRLIEYGESVSLRRLKNTLTGMMHLTTEGLSRFNYIRDAFIRYKERFPMLLIDTGNENAGKLLLGDLREDNTYPVFIDDGKGNVQVDFWVSDLIPMERRILPIKQKQDLKNNNLKF